MAAPHVIFTTLITGENRKKGPSRTNLKVKIQINSIKMIKLTILGIKPIK